MPDSNNHLYVWSSKRENINLASGDYTPVSSDINVFDFVNGAFVLREKFKYIKTGFDKTLQRSDDTPNIYEPGRGLVFVDGTTAAFVAYDSPASQDANAYVVKIDESSVTQEIIVTSKDIQSWDIDIESPMSDSSSGIYFVAKSGDMNAPISDDSKVTSVVYHWTKSGELISLDMNGVNYTANLTRKTLFIIGTAATNLL